MPIRTVNLMSSSPAGPYSRYFLTQDWRQSPRINGKLHLVANPLTFVRVSCDRFEVQPMKDGSYPLRPSDADEGGRTPLGFDYISTDNVAYNRWRGKLFKGGASLGVTLAGWGQSRDMIIARSNQLRRTLDATHKRLVSNTKSLKRIKREREPLANQVLETEFGWRPLFGDFHAALSTVCKDGVPPEWVRARGIEHVQQTDVESNFGRRYSSSYEGKKTTTYAAKVSISNPNLWLLNRMGLINPLTVAWDLVPWSFVVNMFVNVNAMLNSVSDEVGLAITDQSITRSCFFTQREACTHEAFPGASAFGQRRIQMKSRVVNVPLRPTLEVKVPDLNWELALIASALVVQRFRRINDLIRVV